ncbi:MAG: RNA 2',3'-cyclic phosphodiesterase [Clostridiales bacterium]|jgi:2'-5' RNA ligase|nr:RNA 2',3'-cyclic phosphodiesterase [Clostridiales bacterium]
MRLFVAINFDRITIENIAAVQGRLRELGRGNFSRPENLHLTLAFLGEIEPNRVPAVKRAMEATPIKPMELPFDRVGCFPRDGGDIWWIGLSDSPALLKLQGALSDRLLKEGFALESRKFSPHITLAREVHLNSKPDRDHLLGRPFSARADAMRLMRSERIDGKLTYTEQFSVRA